MNMGNSRCIILIVLDKVRRQDNLEYIPHDNYIQEKKSIPIVPFICCLIWYLKGFGREILVCPADLENIHKVVLCLSK